MTSRDLDQEMRVTAFDHVRKRTQVHGYLSAQDLRLGFQFRGERIPLINPQRGIFKPKEMSFLLSIRTVFPKAGAKVWYDDQRDVHQHIFREQDSVEYAFMGDNAEAADNRWLREAYEGRVPIIYFLGISPGRYEALIPSFICGWDRESLKARVSFNVGSADYPVAPETVAERRYALREVQQRLHQSSFREVVIAAYNGRCALSGLPETLLLDAAHIISDRNEELGQPIVQNGIPLSKIHHAAFDSHLIGVDADYKLHVSRRLLGQNDGPMLEALKALHGRGLQLPLRKKDYPDPDRLAVRFKSFSEANSC